MAADLREADQGAPAKQTARKKRTTSAPPVVLTPPLELAGGRPEIGVPVLGREVVIGDVIVFLGRHYRVDRFEPYTGSLRGVLGEGARVAYSGTWGMTIGPGMPVRILPRLRSQGGQA